MDSIHGKLTFDGNGDIEVFLTKVEIQSSLKGYTGEKCAQAIASRLEGPAFDVYLRMSSDDRKDADKIKAELLKEFKRGKRNREEALDQLGKRSRQEGESAQNYAYKLKELVKLAYPSFQNKIQDTIAKDYFVKGAHNDMQVALKSLQGFEERDINKIADETTRLELAGIQAIQCVRSRVNTINQISDESTIINSIANKVIEKLQSTGLSAATGGIDEEAVNYAGMTKNRGRGGQGRGYGARFNRRPDGNMQERSTSRGRPAMNQGNLKCRSCQSTGHLYRFCPQRFCQACGKKGHDAWDKSCPNYQ